MKKLPRYANEILESHRLCCQDIVGGRLEVLQRQLCCPVQRRYVRRIMDFIIYNDGFVASPEALKDFVYEIERNWYQNFSEVPVLYKSVNDTLRDIFNYENFASRKGQGKKGGGIPLLRTVLKYMRYCPYCNADMVYTIKCDDNGKSYKSAFDHFYPRSRYPFLGLSLYNLIPSCDRCNSKFKLDKYKEVLGTFHPYLDDVDSETHFILSGLTNEMRHGVESADDLKIRLVPRLTAANNVEASLTNYQSLYRIDDVYGQLYQEMAVQTLQIGELINESYREEIKAHFLNVGICADPVKIILGTPLKRKEINKYHVAKLKLDLLEQYCGVHVEP